MQHVWKKTDVASWRSGASEREREETGGQKGDEGREKRDQRGLGEYGPASSRMTIISGHWVDGAWRLSFALYSYACPSCLSKPSLF